jgi:predicted aspartyl protease
MIDRVLRTAAAVAWSGALLLPLPSRAAGEDAAALLAKHQAYVGWHIGDGVVKTLRATGTVTRDAKTVGTLTLLRFGIAMRRTFVDDQGLENASGFTGSVYWTSGSNGFTVQPVGEVARYLYDQEAISGELTGQMTPQLLRHEQVDGTDTAVLRLSSQVGFPMDVYVDPATGAYKRVVIDPDGKYETAFNGISYAEVDGKHFIATYHVNDSKYITSYTKFEVNVPGLALDDLRPPKQTASWTFAEGSTPVELTTGNFPRIYIDAVMNGVKGRFVLDTGAGATVILDSFARQIGAKPVGKTTIMGASGAAKANLYRLDTIAVGPSVLHNVVVTSGLFEEFKNYEDAVGLIGFDLLAGAIVDLDLDAKTLRVYDPTRVAPDQTKGIVVHADLSTHLMRVPMKLNDKYDVIASLDSGNPLNVLFSRDLITRDHMPFFVDPYQLGSTRYGSGVSGAIVIEHCGKLSALQLGPISYKPVPACDSTFESRNEILVGLDFMKAFNYVFDYPDGIIMMTPRKM